MSKKKHPEHVNHERWLVSYADFITLLFAFFVVLFASSQSDKKKQIQLASAMQTAFTPLGVFDAHSKTPPLTPTTAASAKGTPSPLLPPMPTADELATGDVRAIQARITQVLHEDKSSSRLTTRNVVMHTTREGLVVSLREAGFFASGSAEIEPAALPLLRKLAATLPSGALRVEGHTDTVPIHTTQFPTNWELSTTRATNIARVLLEYGRIVPADLSAAGYAEYHPAACNTTVEGRAQNRRVDIVLLRPAPIPAPALAEISKPKLPVPSR